MHCWMSGEKTGSLKESFSLELPQCFFGYGAKSEHDFVRLLDVEATELALDARFEDWERVSSISLSSSLVSRLDVSRNERTFWINLYNFDALIKFSGAGKLWRYLLYLSDKMLHIKFSSLDKANIIIGIGQLRNIINGKTAICNNYLIYLKMIGFSSYMGQFLFIDPPTSTFNSLASSFITSDYGKFRSVVRYDISSLKSLHRCHQIQSQNPTTGPYLCVCVWEREREFDVHQVESCPFLNVCNLTENANHRYLLC